MTGPLGGVRVLELAGLAAAPFACMVLSDLGAEVLRIDRADRVAPTMPDSDPLSRTGGRQATDPLARGRRSAAIDLKSAGGVDAVLRLVGRADVLIEGFRPGVTERLGLGPEACHARNPGLVYGRLTGWGQDGPMAQVAGHDLNYLAIGGALHAIGGAGGPPLPPLNLVADFGGGGMLLALGVVAALFERQTSGRGQIVDAAMVDGVALLTAFLHGLRATGAWVDDRGANLLDGGAPFYRSYETADGKYLAVAALEPQFYAALLAKLGIDPELLPAREDRGEWPGVSTRLAAEFGKRTRDEWTELFAGSDACVTPVLTPGEAVEHPHNVARATFAEVDGMPQPAPAPRFSRTSPTTPTGAPAVGEHTTSALSDWGFSAGEIADLVAAGAIAQAVGHAPGDGS